MDLKRIRENNNNNDQLKKIKLNYLKNNIILNNSNKDNIISSFSSFDNSIINSNNIHSNNYSNNSSSNNNNNNNNKSNLPKLPIYLQKVIIKLLCNKIDKYNKTYMNYYINDELIEMDNIYKFEIQSFALVNWCWFNCMRENLTVSHDFLSYHYYPNLFDLEGEVLLESDKEIQLSLSSPSSSLSSSLTPTVTTLSQQNQQKQLQQLDNGFINSNSICSNSINNNRFNHFIINRINKQLNNSNNNNNKYKLICDNNIIELKLNFRDYFNKKNLNNQYLIKKIIHSINRRIKSLPNLKKIYVANRYYPFVSTEEQKQWEIINLIDFNNISTRISYLDKRVSKIKEIQFLYGTVHSVKEIFPFLKSLDVVEQIYLNGDSEGFDYPQLYQLMTNESSTNCFTNILDFQVETNISIEDFYYILKLSPNTKILLVNLCFDNLIYELSNKNNGNNSGSSSSSGKTPLKCLCSEDDEDKLNEDFEEKELKQKFNNSGIISSNNKNQESYDNSCDNNQEKQNNNNNNNLEKQVVNQEQQSNNNSIDNNNNNLINIIKPKYFKDYWEYIFNFIINHKKLKNIGFSSSCRLKANEMNNKDLPNEFIESFGSMLVNNQSLVKVHFNRVPIQFLKLLEYLIQNNKRIVRYNCCLVDDNINNNQSKLAQFIKSLNYLLSQEKNNHILKFYLENENQIILLDYKKNK